MGKVDRPRLVSIYLNVPALTPGLHSLGRSGAVYMRPVAYRQQLSEKRARCTPIS
jgi:hypothetical protein